MSPPAQSLMSLSEIAAVVAPLGSAQTLPPNAYRSDQAFEREREAIFYREWICVAREEQLPHPGDYMRVDLLEQPLILVRRADNSLHAMSAICAHRGMPLITDGGNATHFQCPYHLWRYDLEGRLVSKPLMDGVEVPDDCHLPPVQVESWQGFVFVNLDAEAQPLLPRLRALTGIMGDYPMQDMVRVSASRWECPWNWKLLVENFMEAYHHLGPHSESVQPTHPAADSRVSGSVEDGWSVLHMPPREPGSETDALASMIMPSFCWLNLPNNTGAFWYQLCPESADSLTLHIHTLLPEEVANSPARDEAARMMQAVIDGIHGEDIPVNLGPWQGIKSPLARQGYLSRLEESIWQFNQWWLARIKPADSL